MSVKVYKLTRKDGLEYVGVAKRFGTRMWQHRHSKRFEKFPIVEIQILGEFEDYSDALLHEQQMIEKYDTFNNGLNLTKDGSGNHGAKNFTTEGYNHSEETKAKIRQKSIANKNHLHAKRHYDSLTEEEKRQRRLNHSIKTKGKPKSPRLPEKVVAAILHAWFIEKPVYHDVGKTQQNGLIQTYEQAFSKEYSATYNINPTSVRNIINNRTISWKPLYEKIQNMVS